MDPHPLETRTTRRWTDDDNEALETVNRLLFKYDHDPEFGVREFEAALRADGFRCQGPVTDAEVEAAWFAWNALAITRTGSALDAMRTALEAARAVR